MTLSEFALSALAVPYVRCGRSRDGWDCWGLIRCAYYDVLDIELPSFVEAYDERTSYAELMRLISAEKPQWSVVDKSEPMDIGLYRVGPYHTHVSLVLDGIRMLHSETGTGTVIERLDALIWSSRFVGFHRYCSNSGIASA